MIWLPYAFLFWKISYQEGLILYLVNTNFVILEILLIYSTFGTSIKFFQSDPATWGAAFADC